MIDSSFSLLLFFKQFQTTSSPAKVNHNQTKGPPSRITSMCTVEVLKYRDCKHAALSYTKCSHARQLHRETILKDEWGQSIKKQDKYKQLRKCSEYKESNISSAEACWTCEKGTAARVGA